MAGRRTNSNSMTAILVVALNNQKSAFRKEFFKLLNLDDEGYVFSDGTQSVIEYEEINNKEIDLIGKKKGISKLLIEIKVSGNENLQDSQKKGHEYERVYEKNKDVIEALVYLIPDNYTHKKDIPACAKIILWSDIYRLAVKFDNTGLSDYIENFVELPTTDCSVLFTQSETHMLLNSKNLKATFSLGSKIIELGKKITDNKVFFYYDDQFNDFGVGTYLTLNKQEDYDYLFIGFNPKIPSEIIVSIAIKKEYLDKRKIYPEANTSHFDGTWFYFPLFGETEEKVEDNIAKLLSSETDEEQIKNYRNLVSKRLQDIGILK